MDSLERLSAAVRQTAAIRRVRRMQPVGGKGDKIFPPTYPGERTNDPPRHVFERRRIDGQNILCVLLDSVQSQANRLEEALKELRRTGRVAFPVIAVDFSGTEVADIGSITTLDAPHRVFDAIIRDSEHGGRPFRETDEGKRLIATKANHALPIFEISPTALVFGAWNSTGEGGGLGAKFPRCLVSEIVGIGVAVESDSESPDGQRPSGQRTGSRVDPLGIRSGVRVYKTGDGDWTLEPPGKNAKELRPSEINHSNIAPSVEPLGVSIDYALHTFVLSCAALRRLRFADDAQADVAARTCLAALALVGALAQDEAGYFLRSRCDLVPESDVDFQIVRADGGTDAFALTLDEATEMANVAAQRAAAAKVGWRSADLILKPQPKLVSLIQQSREMALRGLAEAEA
jgi:CRISPR-associated protein Csb1